MLKKVSLLGIPAGLLALSAVLVLVAPSLKVNAFDGVGEGTSASPYRITTCTELQAINDDLTAYYVLTGNIDCSASSSWNSGAGFIPIGTGQFGGFQGSFNGRNFTVSGIYINNSTNEDGVFASLTGNILNTTFTSLSVTDAPTYDSVGGLVGESSGGILSGVKVNGTVTGTDVVGGLIGDAENNTQIATSEFTGSATGSGDDVGGIAGDLRNSSINNSFANVTINANQFAGGLAGLASEYGGAGNYILIDNTYAVGSVYAAGWTGSLIGEVFENDSSAVTITSSFAVVTSINSSSTQVPLPVFGGALGGQTPSVNNIFFDQTAADTTNCSGNFAPSCTAVNTDGTQGSYFKDNNDVDPIDNWDFNSTWHASSNSYPTLRAAAPGTLNSVTTPDAPQNVQVTWDGNTPINLSVVWTPSDQTDDGGSTVTGYTVQYQLAGAGSWTSVSGDTQPVIISGYSPGDDINVQVIATNALGDSSPSSVQTYDIPSNNTPTITSCLQLQAIQQDPTATYNLESNIDCSATVGWNSGAGWIPITGFTGTLNGNGYTISGMTIDQPSGSNVGMFADIDNGATVDGINFTGSSIIGSSEVGVLAGLVTGGSISNITADTTSSVVGQNYVGGLIGQLDVTGNDASVTDSSSAANVNVLDSSSSADYFGGLIGQVYAQNGTVTLSTDSTSGSVGTTYSTFDTGGVIGAIDTDNGGVVNSSALTTTGTVYGAASVGGVIGSAQASSVTPLLALTFTGLSASGGTVNCGDACGGVLGNFHTGADATSTLTRSTSSDPVIAGGGFVGGLLGAANGVANSFAISESFATGSISSGGADVGGLVGVSGNQVLSLTDVYATGSVFGGLYVGGLIGEADGTITNAYSTGAVTGNTDLGGIVGLLDSTGNITNAFTLSSIGSGTNTGAVVGQAISGSQINGSVKYDATIAGSNQCTPQGDTSTCVPVNVGDTAPNYFKGNTTDTPMSAWDFSTIWASHTAYLPIFGWAQVNVPTTLTSCQDLQNIQEAPWQNYSFSADIDCSDTQNWNLGAGFIPIANFSGTLNGNGNNISNLNIDSTSGDSGLFANTIGATLENFNFTGGQTYVEGTANLGMLAGDMDGGTITDVTGTGTVNLNASVGFVGGLVGEFTCDGTTTTNSLSGLQMNNVQIEYPGLSNEWGVGGLIGYIDSTGNNCATTIDNSSSTGSGIRSADWSNNGYGIGGLVGEIDTNTSATNNVTIENSFTEDANVETADSESGGLVGIMDVADGSTQNITNSYADEGEVQISSTSTYGGAGGLVGSITGPAQLSQTYSTDYVAGSAMVGGLVGYLDSTSNPDVVNIDQSYTAPGEDNGEVQDTYAGGAGVSGYYGGLVGYAMAATITNTYTTEPMYVNDNDSGGLIGFLIGDLSNSYADGQLNGGTTPSGGLIGEDAGTSSTAQLGLEHNFSVESLTNAVSGTSEQGGLVGVIDMNTTVPNLTSNYFDPTVAGTTDCAWNAGAGTADCSTAAASTYKNTTTTAPLGNWDFNSVWYTRDNNYPVFQFDNVQPDYAIKNCDDLQNMNDDLTGIYTLGNDIDCSATSGWNAGAGFVPIGLNADNGFTGSLNGNGYTIDGLFISTPNACEVGLIGISTDATITNLALTNANVTGQCNVGSVIGYGRGDTLSYISANGTVALAGNSDTAGGLAGDLDDDSSNNPTTVSTSLFTGSVSGSAGQIGGLIGFAGEVVVTDDYANSTVTGASLVGGLIGQTIGTSTPTIVTDSYAAGSVTGCDPIGGLIGSTNYTTLTNTFSAASVNAGICDTYVGGLVGIDSNSGGLWTNNYYDQAASAQTVCVEVTDSSNDCTGVDTAGAPNANYFMNNSTSPPLNQWDFLATWQTNPNSYPTFVASGILPISSCQQLQNINNALGGTYIQTQDIDCSDTVNWNSGAGFVPLGLSSAFTGSYNGEGFTITNLYINLPSTNEVGLFSNINHDTVQNVNLVGGSMTGAVAVGSVVGYLYDASLTNTSSSADVSASSALVGGLIGAADFDDSSSENLNTLSHAGNVTFTGPGYGAGGLIGNFEIDVPSQGEISMNDPSSSGTVTAVGSSSVGGLIGDFSALGSVSAASLNSDGANITATIDATGSENVGGAIGDAENATSGLLFSNVMVSGNVSGNDNTGGFIGQYLSDPSTTDPTGTILGPITVSGNVSSTGQEVGGLAGNFSHTAASINFINDASVSGSVTDVGGQQVGGLFGYLGGTDSTGNYGLTDSFSTGPVSSDGSDVGGLVGTLDSNFPLQNDYSQSTVTGDIAVGGLVGSDSSTIDTSYASGTVTANDLLGGLVGFTDSAITDSFSASPVDQGNSATTYGGLAGDLDQVDGGSLSDDFYDATRSGQTNCSNVPAACSGTAVNVASSDPYYFFDNTTNAPFQNWTFDDSDWISHAMSYPTFSGAPEAGDAQISAVSTDSSITPTWAFTSDGGSAITSYTLRYAPASDPTNWTIVTLSPVTATTATISGLQASTSYLFELMATNSLGSSGWASFTAATQAAPVITPTPTPVTPVVTPTPPVTTAAAVTDNSSGDDSGGTSPATDTGTSTDTSAGTTAASSILLNDYTKYNNGQGQLETLTPGSVVYFLVGTSKHSVTIDSVGPNYVNITVRSTPQYATLYTGQFKNFAVNDSSVKVIQIKLISINGTTATMRFSKLFSGSSSTTKGPSYATLYWLLFLILLILTIYVIAKKRRRNRKDT